LRLNGISRLSAAGSNAGGKAAKVVPACQCCTSSSLAAWVEVVSTGCHPSLCWQEVYVRWREGSARTDDGSVARCTTYGECSAKKKPAWTLAFLTRCERSMSCCACRRSLRQKPTAAGSAGFHGTRGCRRSGRGHPCSCRAGLTRMAASASWLLDISSKAKDLRSGLCHVPSSPWQIALGQRQKIVVANRPSLAEQDRLPT
jgi:hypothetical protein